MRSRDPRMLLLKLGLKEASERDSCMEQVVGRRLVGVGQLLLALAVPGRDVVRSVTPTTLM